jgi:hypothetical protein
MSDLSPAADTRGRSHQLGADAECKRPLNGAPLLPERKSPSPFLYFDRVSKWYGPVIGVNQVSLQLRTGITGLVRQVDSAARRPQAE